MGAGQHAKQKIQAEVSWQTTNTLSGYWKESHIGTGGGNAIPSRRTCPGFSSVNLFHDNHQRDAQGRVQLSGVNLAGTDLSRAFITDADFTDADFSNATLQGAFSRGSVYPNAKFAGAQGFGFTAESADFSRANFFGATLEFARLSGTDLSDCDLTDANLFHADLKGCDLSGATLARTNLIDVELNEGKLFGTHPWQANFYPQDESLNAKEDATKTPIKTGFRPFGYHHKSGRQSPALFSRGAGLWAASEPVVNS